MSEAFDLSTQDCRKELWRRGIIAPWYLRPSQLDIYSLLLSERRPFIEASRRFGKTTAILTFVFEKLLQNPGWIWRWCEPQKDQARKIVMPIIDSMQMNAPKDSLAEYYTTDSVYRFPNGSQLYLLGVNEDKGKSARGPAANGITLDEYGFWTEAGRISRSILYPQLQNQAGQYFIKASTPPEDLGHTYYGEKETAKRKNRYVLKVIYDNEAITPEELEEIIEETGGVDTPDFRREYLCEEVGDPTLRVVPEWSDENVVDDDYPRPEFFTPYIGGDSGADDNTALLFGYYDFLKNETVIEFELILSGHTTKNIVRLGRRIERTLWNTVPTKRRVYDAQKQIVYDIIADHKWTVQPPQKENKTAAIHALRSEVGSRRFKVKRRCTQTIRQMRVGQWRNEKKLDFERPEDDSLGHLDAIAAAIYLNRAIDRKLNPVPPHHGLSKYLHHIPIQSGANEDAALRRAFKPRRIR